jgi:hypothetical protein
VRFGRSRKPPSKHLAYFELLEQMAVPGCAVCGRGARSGTKYLEAFRDEFVTDPDVRERLRESVGFCEAHARELDRIGGPLAVAILYEDLARRLDRELDGSAKSRPRTQCPACVAARQQEVRCVEVLSDFIADPDLADAYRASAGLCREHLLELLRRVPHPERARIETEERSRLQRLMEELAEVQRKHDHRYAREPWGEEATAPSRTVEKIAGSRLRDKS